MSLLPSPGAPPSPAPEAGLVDRIFLAAWSPATHGPLAALIGPIAGRRAGEEPWEEVVRYQLHSPERLPAALPGGEPIPPATTPWGREDSPIPGVDLPVEEVLALAWYTLEPGSLRPAPRDEGIWLGAMVSPALPTELAQALVNAWCHREGPEACIHAAHPRRHDRWFSPSELEAYLGHWRSAALGDEAEAEHRRAAFRLLVIAGLPRSEAAYHLLHGNSFGAELPTGQWVPEQARAAAPEGGLVRLANQLVPLSIMPELLTLLGQGQKIAAIKLVRQKIRCGLKDAKDVAEAIDLHGGPEQRPGPPRARRPAAPGPARRLIEQAIDRLILARPLHWMLLATARILEEESLPTMAVAMTCRGEMALFFSPDFVARLSPAELGAVLQHEINHVLFGHLGPHPAPETPAAPAGPAGDAAAGPAADEEAEERRRRNAWLIACEVIANEYVAGPLPGSPITLSRFGLPAGSTTARHFEVLRRRDDLPDLVDDRRLALLVADPRHSREFDEALYPAVGASLAVARQAVGAVGADLDGETARLMAGTDLGRYLEMVRPEGLGELPWNALLGRLARGLKERFATRSFPSRRAPDRIGIVPGHRSRRDPPVVLAAIDTSGSMTTAELTEISEELLALTTQQVRVVCVQIDTAIRQVDELRRGATIARVVGRGGTDFRPLFHPSFLARHTPSLIVYFTDGEGPAPAAPPAGVEVLWVLTGPSPRVPCRWGRAVCMRPRHGRERVAAPA